MKNKKLKIFLAIILVLILLILINIIRNYFIIKNLYETSQNHSINFNNVLYTCKTTIPNQPKSDGTIGVVSTYNYYFKDNIIKTNYTSNFNGEDSNLIVQDTWKNLETNEFVYKTTLEDSPDANFDYTSDVNSNLLYNCVVQDMNQLLKDNIFSIITSDSENLYKLKYGDIYLHVNKSTGIIENRTHKNEDSIIECSIKENVVTDKDIEKF